MSTMDCIKQTSLNTSHKIFAGRLHKLTKMVKPMLKFLSRKQKTNAVTPSTCNYDVETVQNDVNEAQPFRLNFKFYDEAADNLANEAAEADENAENEALEKRLAENASRKSAEGFGVEKIVDGEVVVEPVVCGTYLAIPVHFVETVRGEFTWAPLPDRDVSVRGFTSESQRPERQVPVTCVSAA